MFEQLLEGRLWAQMGIALILAGAIGLDRQLRGKPAGIRTSILVCLGTVVFVRLSVSLHGPEADPTRVLGQVVTGIGFLGGGVIIRHHGLVHGVTSAAVVWLLAAVGCAIGLHQFGVAVVLTATALVVSVGLEWLENAVPALAKGAHRTDAHHEVLVPDEPQDG